MDFKNLRKLELAGLLILVLSVSCSKDPFPGIREFEEGKGVFILNEGNFTFGNASLSFYDPLAAIVQNDIFYDANGFPVGDALQSMTILDSTGFLCVSNSGKVLVFDVNTFRHLHTISDLGAPRYFIPINPEKAYISDLWNNYLSIYNLEKKQVTGTVSLGNSSEMMILAGGFLFVNSWSYNNKILVVNPETDSLVDSIEVGKQPNSMVLDRDGKLWVLSDGGYPGSPYGQQVASLAKINPGSMEIEHTYWFDELVYSPTYLQVNPAGDTLYFINEGLFRMCILDNVIPGKVFIEENGKNFYSCGIDPLSGDIYISDAGNFLSKGYVYRYNSSGILVDTFAVGLIPGGFCFK